MTREDCFKSLLDKGEEKVPHSYALDILSMLLNYNMDAKMTKLDDNYTKMTLV